MIHKKRMDKKMTVKLFVDYGSDVTYIYNVKDILCYTDGDIKVNIQYASGKTREKMIKKESFKFYVVEG